jgi:CBS-domain-containing membrane protein
VGGPWEKIKKRLGLYAGVAIVIGVVSYLTYARGIPVLITPFAASTCILFAVPNSPVARPKNVILGHAMSAAIGTVAQIYLGRGWMAAAVCVTAAVAAMDATDTMHPPAAATSLQALASDEGYKFIFMPAASGACIIVLAAVVVKYIIHGPRQKK